MPQGIQQLSSGVTCRMLDQEETLEAYGLSLLQLDELALRARQAAARLKARRQALRTGERLSRAVQDEADPLFSHWDPGSLSEEEP